MNTNETQQKFVCDCGKVFDTQAGLSHHKTQCKIFQANKKKREVEKREAKRLPNGLFICENPDCCKEHDGSYGSGRFCSKECKDHYNALTASKTASKNGNKHKPKNFKAKTAPYGTWKCLKCDFIGRTRRELEDHKKKTGHYNTCKGRALSQEHRAKIKCSLKIAAASGKCLGRGSTPEKEKLRRKRMSEAALKRTAPVSTKHTEDYICKDGTVVRLDSSYERNLAKIFDDNDIKWIRPEPLDWYDSKNIKHHYYSDFYLVDYDLYVDPKNEYCFKAQAEKIQYVKMHYKNCVFLHKDDLEESKILDLLETYRSQS